MEKQQLFVGQRAAGSRCRNQEVLFADPLGFF